MYSLTLYLEPVQECSYRFYINHQVLSVEQILYRVWKEEVWIHKHLMKCTEVKQLSKCYFKLLSNSKFTLTFNFVEKVYQRVGRLSM